VQTVAKIAKALGIPMEDLVKSVSNVEGFRTS